MEARLKKFAQIVDYGSYTLAAQRLHTSQPALSVAMQKLAKELKAELFVHSARDFMLSKAGNAAYKRGKALILQEQNFLDEIMQIQTEKIPIRIGAIDSLAELLAAHNMFEALETNTRVSLIVQNSTELQKLLQQGNIDLALTTAQDLLADDIVQQPLGSENLTLVCAPGMQWKPVNKLLTPFLAYNHESNTYRIIDTQLRAAGYIAEPLFYSTNPSVILQLALQGKGVAVLPRSMTELHVARQKLIEITLDHALMRPLSALWLSERVLPQEITMLLNSISIELATSA